MPPAGGGIAGFVTEVTWYPDSQLAVVVLMNSTGPINPAALGGELAAEVMPWKRPEPKPFRYRNFGNLATIGRRAAVADFGWLRVSGRLAWVLWGLVHIYFLIGFRNRIAVLLDWLWAYITFQRGARLITGPNS